MCKSLKFSNYKCNIDWLRDCSCSWTSLRIPTFTTRAILAEIMQFYPNAFYIYTVYSVVGRGETLHITTYSSGIRGTLLVLHRSGRSLNNTTNISEWVLLTSVMCMWVRKCMLVRICIVCLIVQFCVSWVYCTLLCFLLFMWFRKLFDWEHE